MASIKKLYYKKIEQDILDDKNNDYKWLNIKLKKHFRIDDIDKINNYFVKPNDCRWWFGNTKKIRYNNICKKMPRGNRKDMQMLLEHIVHLRISYPLFIPPHPILGYKFEKDITNPGSYQLCYKGVVVNKIIKQNQQNNDEEDNRCPICYEDINLNKNYVATICGHKFCSICIFKHINLGKEQCPLCRANIISDKTYIDLNYDDTEEDITRFSQPPPRWIFPRTPPQRQQENRFTLRTPQHIMDRVNQDIQNDLNPRINNNFSGLITPRTTRSTSIIRLPPEISRNPLFTETDISQIRNGYNEPILNALEELREFYNDSNNSNSDDENNNIELVSTTQMTGILANLNDSITNSPVRFYNNNDDVTDEIFSNELTNALNNFIDETTISEYPVTNIPILNLNTDNTDYTPSIPLVRNREITNTDNEFYYFYSDVDLEPSIPPQPISPPREPDYQVITDISLNDIDSSFNFYRLHDFI